MGEMRDSDWSRPNLLRSDWLPITGATMTTNIADPLSRLLHRKVEPDDHQRCTEEYVRFVAVSATPTALTTRETESVTVEATTNCSGREQTMESRIKEVIHCL